MEGFPVYKLFLNFGWGPRLWIRLEQLPLGLLRGLLGRRLIRRIRPVKVILRERKGRIGLLRKEV